MKHSSSSAFDVYFYQPPSTPQVWWLRITNDHWSSSPLNHWPPTSTSQRIIGAQEVAVPPDWCSRSARGGQLAMVRMSVGEPAIWRHHSTRYIQTLGHSTRYIQILGFSLNVQQIIVMVPTSKFQWSSSLEVHLCATRFHGWWLNLVNESFVAVASSKLIKLASLMALAARSTTSIPNLSPDRWVPQ